MRPTVEWPRWGRAEGMLQQHTPHAEHREMLVELVEQGSEYSACDSNDHEQRNLVPRLSRCLHMRAQTMRKRCVSITQLSVRASQDVAQWNTDTEGQEWRGEFVGVGGVTYVLYGMSVNLPKLRRPGFDSTVRAPVPWRRVDQQQHVSEIGMKCVADRA